MSISQITVVLGFLWWSRVIGVEISKAAIGTDASTAERKILGWMLGFSVESLMYAAVLQMTEGGQWASSWQAGLALTFFIRTYVFFKKSKQQPSS